MKKGHRVCTDTAIFIRKAVSDQLAENGRVDPILVRKILKPAAESDAITHENWDQHFEFGRGPAVERH